MNTAADLDQRTQRQAWLLARAGGQRLTPVRQFGKAADGHITWLFVCECGKEKVAKLSSFKSGSVRSCGCLAREAAHAVKHGMHNSPTYVSWSSAKDRSTNPSSKDFHRYGAVGIGFSDRWQSFENFLSDMGERPRGTTLDRIDPSKGYEPGNCRWATPTEQMRNRKDAVYVVTDEGRMALVEYAKKIGISKGAAHLRLKRGKLEGAIRG